MAIRIPRPLVAGDVVALTAPSSGVRAPLHPRLDRAIEALRSRGLRVVEGATLRQQAQGQSAPARERAEELMDFLLDPTVAAVLPPWGGERALEVLRHLDARALAAATPKWLSGFSDVSTLQVAMLTRFGWGSLHGPNLMELGAATLDATTARMFDVLFAGRATADAPLVQSSAPRHRRVGAGNDWAGNPAEDLVADTPVRWRRLDGSDAPLTLRGRLVGGCLDTLARLAGTPWGDVPGFVRAAAGDGALLFLENAEMPPFELVRALTGLRLAGWLDGLSGVLVGRNAGPANPNPASGFADVDACAAALGDLPCPVLLDLDIGHLPPQLSLVQGAMAEVTFADGAGRVAQWW